MDSDSDLFMEEWPGIDTVCREECADMAPVYKVWGDGGRSLSGVSFLFDVGGTVYEAFVNVKALRELYELVGDDLENDGE